MHAVRLAMGAGQEAFAPGAQQIAIVVEYRDRMLATIEGIDNVLAVHPYCGAIPKRDLVRDFGPVFLDLEGPFAVAEPLRHRFLPTAAPSPPETPRPAPPRCRDGRRRSRASARRVRVA